MKRFLCVIAVIVGGVALSAPVAAAPIIFNDEAAFRVAAARAPAPVTTYGFETHGLVEGAELAFSSPLAASQLDNRFGLAYTNLNGVSIDNTGPPGAADGTRSLFTNSVDAPNYTLTFSNFGGSNASITAFGLTITDFASSLTVNDPPATITFDTGGLAGTLLTVAGGQPGFTQNFVGLTVDGVDAFPSITLTLNDNLSGMQWFDEVIYSQTEGGGPGSFTTGFTFTLPDRFPLHNVYVGVQQDGTGFNDVLLPGNPTMDDASVITPHGFDVPVGNSSFDLNSLLGIPADRWAVVGLFTRDGVDHVVMATNADLTGVPLEPPLIPLGFDEDLMITSLTTGQKLLDVLGATAIVDNLGTNGFMRPFGESAQLFFFSNGQPIPGSSVTANAFGVPVQQAIPGPSAVLLLGAGFLGLLGYGRRRRKQSA